MPYIKKEQRAELTERNAKNSGEFNYLVTLWLHKHFTNYASLNNLAFFVENAIFALISNSPGFAIVDHKAFYELRELIDKNKELSPPDRVGALRCAWNEFYRRKAGPYEDTKIEENGDV